MDIFIDTTTLKALTIIAKMYEKNKKIKNAVTFCVALLKHFINEKTSKQKRMSKKLIPAQILPIATWESELRKPISESKLNDIPVEISTILDIGFSIKNNEEVSAWL